MISLTLTNVLVMLFGLGGIYIFLFSKLTSTSSWYATITPLASIIGSGFLIAAPLLYSIIGHYAIIAMIVLLALSYAVGSVIRYNILHAEPILPRLDGKACDVNSAGGDKPPKFLHGIERISHVVLIAAYCISVCYYLELLANFSLSRFSWHEDIISKWFVTLIIVGIGAIGLIKGLKGLEHVEKYAVGLKLAIIMGLIAGLAMFNIEHVVQGDWAFPHLPVTGDPWHNLRILMGLLIVVQGFETSRFLGAHHCQEERVTTMRNAQLISAAIYMSFICLLAVVVTQQGAAALSTEVTEIITLTGVVATALPFMIIIAALSSQFSAAIADGAGCAGILQSFRRTKTKLNYEYMAVAVGAIALTWATDIFDIITLASRAFALYYAIQCFVAMMVAWSMKHETYHLLRFAFFSVIGFICVTIFIFGIPADVAG